MSQGETNMVISGTIMSMTKGVQQASFILLQCGKKQISAMCGGRAGIELQDLTQAGSFLGKQPEY